LAPYQKALVEYEGKRLQKPELTFDHFMLNDGAPHLQMLQLFDALSTTLPRQPEVLELFQLGDRLKRQAISGSGVESKDLAMVEAMSRVTPETLKTLQYLQKSMLSPAEKQARVEQLVTALGWQAPADASNKVKKMYEVLAAALLQEASR
jgi:hypothetical protein